MSQKGYQLLIFSRAIGHRVTKIPAYNECALSRHRPRAARYLKLRIFLSTDEVFKSLITKLAGFSWWYWMIEVFISDYIIQILNSQHGWISIVIINNQCYDWGFQSCFSAMAIILSMDMIYSTMEGIVPSCCRLMTRHLGAILFRLRSYQICKSHVTASMHHGTWGLM